MPKAVGYSCCFSHYEIDRRLAGLLVVAPAARRLLVVAPAVTVLQAPGAQCEPENKGSYLQAIFLNGILSLKFDT